MHYVRVCLEYIYCNSVLGNWGRVLPRYCRVRTDIIRWNINLRPLLFGLHTYYSYDKTSCHRYLFPELFAHSTRYDEPSPCQMNISKTSISLFTLHLIHVSLIFTQSCFSIELSSSRTCAGNIQILHATYTLLWGIRTSIVHAWALSNPLWLLHAILNS